MMIQNVNGVYKRQTKDLPWIKQKQRKYKKDKKFLEMKQFNY